MGFISIRFLIFFLVLLVLLKVTKERKVKHIILLCASYVFYGMGDIRFLGLLICISVFMWWCGIKLERSHARTYLFVGVGANVLILGVFKYANFFLNTFFTGFGLQKDILQIVLPVGISFYSFQAISYLCDVYRGENKAESSLLNVMLYIGFFPQIIAGPIVKAHKFLPQLEMDHEINLERLSYGGQKFLVGIFKKVVLADRLGLCVDAVYATPAAYSGLSLLVTALAYSLQIYYDFSGYSDMAIGIAYILGFDLGKNFNLPYLASNPSDFWRRWHISLSSWFRDYVYIPLGGNRKGNRRMYFNLFATMLLSGLWHGASWSFVIWGALHGLVSIGYKVFEQIKKKYRLGFQDQTVKRITKCIAIFLTFIIVSLLWIPFRVDDMGTAVLILKRIFTWSSGVHYVYVFALIFGLGLLIIQAISVWKNNGKDIYKPLDLSRLSSKVIFVCFVFFTIIFAYIGESAFIYAQF